MTFPAGKVEQRKLRVYVHVGVSEALIHVQSYTHNNVFTVQHAREQSRRSNKSGRAQLRHDKEAKRRQIFCLVHDNGLIKSAAPLREDLPLSSYVAARRLRRFLSP